MPFELYDHVRIENKDVTGEIIDTYVGKDQKTYYVVESDQRGPVDDPDAFGDEWPQYDCTEDEITKI